MLDSDAIAPQKLRSCSDSRCAFRYRRKTGSKCASLDCSHKRPFKIRYPRVIRKGMHVVFVAGGALGAAIVQNLSHQNKAGPAVVRDDGRARKVLPRSAEIVLADASKPDSIKPAFHNVSVIYHCVNVPYDKWTEVVPLVTGNILAGAIETQANVVFPGNVYVYGRFQSVPLTEDHALAVKVHSA